MFKKAIFKIASILDESKLRKELDKCDLIHKKLGTEYGGWYIPENILTSSSICFCVGAGEDITFDIELINKFNCEVFVFDPTPRAKSHVNQLIEKTKNNNSRKIEQFNSGLYTIDRKSVEKLHFHDYGVWSENKMMRFYSPINSKHVSHSIVNLQSTLEYFEAECLSIKSIINKLNVNSPNLVKLDIEGAEYDVLDSMIKDEVFPEILCVEYDEHRANKIDNQYMSRILNSISKIKKAGYIMSFLDNRNVTFVRK